MSQTDIFQTRFAPELTVEGTPDMKDSRLNRVLSRIISRMGSKGHSVIATLDAVKSLDDHSGMLTATINAKGELRNQLKTAIVKSWTEENEPHTNVTILPPDPVVVVEPPVASKFEKVAALKIRNEYELSEPEAFTSIPSRLSSRPKKEEEPKKYFGELLEERIASMGVGQMIKVKYTRTSAGVVTHVSDIRARNPEWDLTIRTNANEPNVACIYRTK